MTLPEPRHTALPLVSRVFTVLAATLLLAALALGTLSPTQMSLGAGIEALDGALMAKIQKGVTASAGAWLWRDLAMPLLVRPIWLVPLCLGFICGGVAASFSISPPRHTRRRRS